MEVSQAIAEALRVKGRLTFAQYMDLALYLPEAGYYAAPGELPGRDYRTSPAVHPLFGALVALQLEQMWQALGEPCRFLAVEAGAGDGVLCRDILRFSAQLAPAFATALRYVIVEPRPAGRRRQRATVPAELVPQVSWVQGSALAMPLTGVVGCILSNELVDAFPVHRVLRRQGVLCESFVVERSGTLAEVLDEPSTPELAAYFARLGIEPPEGCLMEVNLAAVRFIREAAAALDRGFLLTIDYGLPAEELFSAGRTGGTLRCYHRHQCNDDPFRAVGGQDITTHVDFSTLVVAGREAGLKLTGLTRQRDLLRNLGVEAFVAQLEGSGLPPGRQYENKFALQDLSSKAGLGRFVVLIQHKGVDDPELDAFNPCNDRKRGLLAGSRHLAVPLLDGGDGANRG